MVAPIGRRAVCRKIPSLRRRFRSSRDGFAADRCASFRGTETIRTLSVRSRCGWAAGTKNTPGEAIERVVEVIRAEQPQVVVTYDERGGYGHPDHVRAHQVAVAAFEAASNPNRFPAAGAAWAPGRLYYSVVPRSAMLRFMERLRE